jgi:Predicted membrane protein
MMMQNKIILLFSSITLSTLTSWTNAFSIIHGRPHITATSTSPHQHVRTKLQATTPNQESSSSTSNQHDENNNNADQQEEQDTNDASLIIGKEMGQALQKIATEAGYLEAARKRNQEAKLKLMQQIQQEEMEAERYRKEVEERGSEGNFGPQDMSTFVGFKEDGFEESEGNDDMGGWSELKQQQGEQQQQQEEEKEEPKLFLLRRTVAMVMMILLLRVVDRD